MPEWTCEQQRAISEKGNLLVSAAAGAGKTAVMTERIARLISEGVNVNEILAVTFTKSAASEMKQRISKRLSDLAESETNPEKKENLSIAANDVSHASISTFHSFCGNLLKRCCHEVDLDPAFRTLDEPETVILKYDALDETLEEAYLKQEKEPSRSFKNLCAVIKNNDALSELILNIYTFIMARPEPFDWLNTAVSAYDKNFNVFSKRAADQLIKIAKRNIRVFYEKADSLYRDLESIFPSDPMKYEHTLFSDMELLNAFLQLSDYDSWHKALHSYELEKLPRSGKGETAPEEIKDFRKAVKDYLKKLKDVFPENLETEAEEAKAIFPLMKQISELVENFHEKFTQKKRELSAIDFNDMEQLTLRALKNPETASEYREKFKYIFIDEYQDTNAIQEKIISLIAGKDNLFMVGDVKQSIYRFRQAEPENFLDKYNNYDGTAGKRIDLNANFRSYTSILGAVNFLFSKLMLGEIGEIDYSDNAALIPGNTSEPGETEIIILTDTENDEEIPEEKEKGESSAADDPVSDDDGNAALDNVCSEAQFTAEKILYLMDNAFVSDKNAENGKRRPVFSDFAVLLRKTKNTAIQWVNTLTAAGIPCIADLGDGFFNAMEVQIFMNLLRIIDNKHQDIPLMSVLCSPIGSFSEKELVSIRCDYYGDDLYSKLANAAAAFKNDNISSENKDNKNDNDNNNDPEDTENTSSDAADTAEDKNLLSRAASFIDKLACWQKESRFMKLDEFIGMLIDSTFFYAYTGALAGGDIRKANLDMLVNLAHNYEADGRRGLYGFISFLDKINEKSSLSSAAAPALNAVHVMSIHKSKGLEFPIVFIGGLFAFFNKQSHSNSVLLDPLLGIGLKLRNKNFSKSLLFRAILARDDEKALAEEMRILYVAMTRARERLYMVGSPSKKYFDIEKGIEPLSDYQITNTKFPMKWIMGAFFPGPLSDNSDKSGIIKRLRSFDGGKITLSVQPRSFSAVSGGKMSKERFSEWKASALLSDPEKVLNEHRFDYSFKDETTASSKKSVTELIDTAFEYTPAVPAFIDKKHTAAGAEKGTAVHKALQLLPLRAMNESEVYDLIRLFIEENKISSEFEVSDIAPSVIQFLNSPLYERILASGRVEKELEFSLLLSDEDIKKALKHKDNSVENVENSSLYNDLNEGSLLQGVIDCCFLENEEWVIIDYKTTALKNSTPFEVASRYEVQLDMYSVALEKLTGFPVREKWVFLTEAGMAVLL